jgi:hypothetical protein
LVKYLEFKRKICLPRLKDLPFISFQEVSQVESQSLSVIFIAKTFIRLPPLLRASYYYEEACLRYFTKLLAPTGTYMNIEFLAFFILLIY